MISYCIVEEDSAEDVITRVNELLRNKWKPIGGIAIYVDKNGRDIYYAQAMIKEE